MAHVKATHRIIKFMEESDKEAAPEGPSQPPAPYSTAFPNSYYDTSPSDVPQDMSLSNLNYSINYANPDRMSSWILTF